jgi:Ca2+-binding RTX toxin-like protein
LRPQTVERINYDRNINGRVTALGLDGDDTFISDDNAAIMTLDGGAGDDVFQFGQVFGVNPLAGNSGIAQGDGIDTILTTRGYLSAGISRPTIAFGGGGNDTFVVYSNRAQLKLEGEAGNDDFVVRAFLIDNEGGSSTQETTEILGGNGDDKIEYNINSPVDIDGGAGFDTVIVLGTEGPDNFVITENGIFGAGLNIRISNTEESIEVDGLEGDDTFFILSTAEGAVTNVIGGLGSDTFIVTGDVTGTITAKDLEGRSGLVNHKVASTDDAYDETFAAGLGTTIADEVQGKILISQEAVGDLTSGKTEVSEADGGLLTDIYSVALAAMPLAGSTVYVTVSAARSSTEDRSLTVPVMADGAKISFVAGGTTLTRDSGSWMDEGFDVYQSIELTGTADGDSDGVYEIISVTGTQIVVGQTFATTQTNLETASVTGQQASSVLVSAGGGVFTDTLVLEFNALNYAQEQIVTILAQDDAAKEGQRKVVISHSVISDDPSFDSANVQNLVVEVADDDLAGVRVLESGSETQVLEGANAAERIVDTWDVVLTRAPDDGEIVTVSLSDNSTEQENDPGVDLTYVGGTLTFTHNNWNIAQTVTVTAELDGRVENEERVTVTHGVTTTGAAYATAASEELRVAVIDGDSAGVLVRETNGDTIVIDKVGSSDTYTVRLTKAPLLATDTVTVNVFDDGQTRIIGDSRVTLTELAASNGIAAQFVHQAEGTDYISRTTGSWRDDGFASGQTLTVTGSASNNGDWLVSGISKDGKSLVLAAGLSLTAETAPTASFAVEAGQITFDASNWFKDVTVKLEADPAFEPNARSYISKVFPAEEHTTSKVFGPLIIDGGPTDERTIAKAVMLPTESDPGPEKLDIVTDETKQNDRVNIFNDMDVTDAIGTMTTATVGGREGILINGLGMGTGLVPFDEGDAITGEVLVYYPQGITMRTIEIIDVLLGEGNDTFTIDATNIYSDNTESPAVTAIHGGGGQDTITATQNAVGGEESLLVLYGDTVTDGSRYNYLGAAPTGGGLVFDATDFPALHADTIDVSAMSFADPDAIGVTIYGGIGDDTITGSAGADHIAGGGGSDTIKSLAGNDHIYGDNGFIVELYGRELIVVDAPVAVPLLDSADTRIAVADFIDAGDGDDIVISDLGFISQIAGTLRLTTTGSVTRVETTQAAFGGNDVVTGGAGNDIVLAGSGRDMITGGAGDNIIFGDHGVIDYVVADGDIADIDYIGSLFTGFGDSDTISSEGGSDILVGGFGADVITSINGNTIVIGDAGEITAAAGDNPQYGGIAMTLGTANTLAVNDGAADQITTGTGADLILGGAGGDAIIANAGEVPQVQDDAQNLVVGDFGRIEWSSDGLRLERVISTDTSLTSLLVATAATPSWQVRV